LLRSGHYPESTSAAPESKLNSAIDSHLYLASEEAEVYVIKAGPQFELLSKNLLGEIAMASPAVSENALYYRTRGHVVAIAEK
jgi:hypothetical protein